MQQTTLFQTEGLVAGVDEAGRGPLAGPVVAAAVVLPDAAGNAEFRDSKTLTAAARDRLAADVRRVALGWSVAWCDRAEIDSLNILHATMLAMRRAILGLAVLPAAVVVDGNRLPNLRFGGRLLEGSAVVRGDATVPAISAASILAKTERDRIMTALDALYPHYGFARHKGYGTAMHTQQLQAHGPCNEHRRSFAPVRALL